MSNIPIYRAKKIDSEERVEGYLVGETKIAEYEPEYNEGYVVSHQFPSNGVCESTYGQGWFTYKVFEIDSSTLSIHFTDMLDGEGNKIFASLSEDGKGGDKFDFEIYCCIDGWYKEKGVLVYDCEDFAFKVHCEYEGEVKLYNMQEMSNFKITGIKQ